MAHKELEVRNSLSPSIEIQKWLQITYELELKAYNEKKTHAEQQLLNAKVCLFWNIILKLSLPKSDTQSIAMKIVVFEYFCHCFW